MNIQESAEMYLEAILILSKESGIVRSIDIVNHTGYSKPSISRAVNLLKKHEYIDIDEKGHISLKPEGLKIAEKIYHRHLTLTKILVSLGVDEETADQDACRIEHVLSDESFEKIKEKFKDTIKEG